MCPTSLGRQKLERESESMTLAVKKTQKIGGDASPKSPKSNEDYHLLLEKLHDIPTLPLVAVRVNELINDPTSSSSDIAKVLKKDQVLTAKILRLVNSTYYAIPGGVTDVQRALAFLGFNTLAQLILGLSVFNIFQKLAGEELTMLSFWKHALGTAICTESLAKQLNYQKPEEAFTCGLLHDIGKLVLHEIDPKRLFRTYEAAKKRKTSFVKIEREGSLPSHAYLGEMIAAKWGLPQIIRLSIRYHHHDVSNMSSILDSEKPIIQMVNLANAICVKNNIGKSGDCSGGDIDPNVLKSLGLDMNDIEKIEDNLEKDMEKAGAFLTAYA